MVLRVGCAAAHQALDLPESSRPPPRKLRTPCSEPALPAQPPPPEALAHTAHRTFTSAASSPLGSRPAHPVISSLFPLRVASVRDWVQFIWMPAHSRCSINELLGSDMSPSLRAAQDVWGEGREGPQPLGPPPQGPLGCSEGPWPGSPFSRRMGGGGPFDRACPSPALGPRLFGAGEGGELCPTPCLSVVSVFPQRWEH